MLNVEKKKRDNKGRSKKKDMKKNYAIQDFPINCIQLQHKLLENIGEIGRSKERKKWGQVHFTVTVRPSVGHEGVGK